MKNWDWTEWFSDFAVAGLDAASRCVWFELKGAMIAAGRSRIDGDADALARITRSDAGLVGAALRRIGAAGLAEISEHDGVYRVDCPELAAEARRAGERARLREAAAERLRRWRAARKQEHPDNPPSLPPPPVSSPPPSPNDGKIIDACERIFARHPRRVSTRESLLEIHRAIHREIDRGKSTDDAIALIESKTAEYADAVKTWLPNQKRFIKGSREFFAQSCYLDDPAYWWRDDAGNGAADGNVGHSEVVL